VAVSLVWQEAREAAGAGAVTPEYTDRYQALGIPYPDPATVCKGPCEGTGVYPVQCQEFVPLNNSLQSTDLKRAFGEHVCNDGWHFVECEVCHGTGKKPPEPEAQEG
jgi:hypothetical protein